MKDLMQERISISVTSHIPISTTRIEESMTNGYRTAGKVLHSFHRDCCFVCINIFSGACPPHHYLPFISRTNIHTKKQARTQRMGGRRERREERRMRTTKKWGKGRKRQYNMNKATEKNTTELHSHHDATPKSPMASRGHHRGREGR